MLPRLTLKQAKEILYDMYYNGFSNEKITEVYGINERQIYNLRSGKTFPKIPRPETPKAVAKIVKENRVKNKMSEVERSFISTLRKHGLGVKQIHIIVGNYTYDTIMRVSKEASRPYTLGELPELDARLETFELMCVPYEGMVNQVESRLTFSDFVYMVFLARMNVPFEKALRAFREPIEFETSVWENPIQTEEELLKYLSWGSTKSKVISILGNIHKNKIKEFDGKRFYFDDVSLKELSRCCPDLNLSIARDIIEFETQEGYKRREDIESE